MSSAPPSGKNLIIIFKDSILYNSFTAISIKTEDKLTVLTQNKVTNTQLSLGVPVEPWPEYQELVVLVPTDPDKLPSEINAEKVECSPPSKPGEDGTEE